MGKAVLLTGVPGSGKTTAIRKALTRLDCRAGGFFTQEIRLHGRRVGFKLVTLDGQEGILAHVDITSPDRVGRYGVDLAALDTIGVEAIQRAITDQELVVIDEIGPMELLSERFRQTVLAALRSERPVLGSIVQRPTPFTEQIKALPSVRILRIHPGNRDSIVKDIIDCLRRAGLVTIGTAPQK